MKSTDEIFRELVEDVLVNGNYMDTRNGKVVRSTNKMITFDSTPLIGIRKTSWKNALREWEWFMSGSSHLEDLHPSVRSWWEPFAVDGCVNYNYSAQLRMAVGYDLDKYCDQIMYLIDGIKSNPTSRRLVATTWNASDMTNSDCPITNCHGTVIQFFAQPNGKLDLTMYQRSCDLMLGVPHNWIQYWAFLQYMAHVTGKLVGSFTWVGGDVHVYNSHIEMAYKMLKHNEQLPRVPQMEYYPSEGTTFKADDFVLDAEYEPVFKERLKMEV